MSELLGENTIGLLILINFLGLAPYVNNNNENLNFKCGYDVVTHCHIIWTWTLS